MNAPQTLNTVDDRVVDAITTGSPRFADPELAAIAARDGDLAAWRRAFARDGARAPLGVSGDFAVALREAGGGVWLAVDRFAIRSLCFHVDGGALRFAERADGLGTPSVASVTDIGAATPVPAGAGPATPTPADAMPPTPISAQGLYDYFYFHAIPSPRTVFDGVQRVPAAHCVRFDGSGVVSTAYWTPRFSESARGTSFDALKTEFRALLKGAVASQLDSGKAGCFLSGGTDSSTVTGMIREATGRGASTYSIGFEADGYDEMAFARLAAKRFGAEHHEYYVTPDDLVRTIPEVAAWYDQPFGNSSALPAYHCALMARADGVTRILAGDGGDELFGGNTRYAKQRVFGWYERLPAGLRQHLLEPLFEQPAVARAPLLSKGSSYIEQAKVPLPERSQMYNLLLRLGTADVMTPGFLARVDTASPGRQQRVVWDAAEAANDLNRNLAYDWRYTLAETDLPKVTGTTRMAGLEVGFPMLDQRLVEFSERLPAEMKLKGMKLRWFFKEALRGFLPDEILVKKKQGFGLPFGVWLTRHDGLRRLAFDALGSLGARGIVRPEFVRSLIDHRLAEHPAYYGEMVWIMTMLEYWLRKHAPDQRF